MTFWVLFLGSCVVATIISTLLWKRPMVAAIGVSVLAGTVLGLHDATTSAFWVFAIVVGIVGSLPATVVTAIVTENLMDKYAPHWND